jgi:putative phosphoribosyl transferase
VGSSSDAYSVSAIIRADGVPLRGDIDVPREARGIVVFAHGSGSSRLSPRNREVAAGLRASGHFGTLLFDLLTPGEDSVYANRFDIPLLAGRLISVTRWLLETPAAAALPIGYFGASTGAAAALTAAAEMPFATRAVVSRGGRPDLAGAALERVTAPTLLIVGGDDTEVISLNESALARLASSAKRLEIVPGATHLFEEPGTMQEVSRLSAAWFEEYLVP